MNRPRRIGLPWYAPEHYETLRESLTDGARLPPQYETWRMAFEQVEHEVQRSGVAVVRVPIELEAFTAWCEQSGLKSNGEARAQYAASVVEAAP